VSAFKKDRTGAMAAPKTLESPLARSVPRTEIENSGLFVNGTLRNGGVWRAAAIISRTSSANDRPKRGVGNIRLFAYCLCITCTVS